LAVKLECLARRRQAAIIFNMEFKQVPTTGTVKRKELTATLKRQMHDAARVAYLAGLPMEDIIEVLKHHAWWANYIRSWQRYPHVVAEPCDA
jgi:hypothetical protein